MAALDEVFTRAKQRITRDFIESHFHHPRAEWAGRNYQTVSPLRADSNPGSFSIREDGVYFDRATGEAGDIIDLLAKANGITLMEAAMEILGESYEDAKGSLSSVTEEPPAPIKLTWLPIPDGKVPQFKLPPDDITLYHSGGKPAFYIVRYNAGPSVDKKIIYPLYWTGNMFEKGFPENLKKKRPLFQVDTSRTVIIVEGELKRRLAQEAYPQFSWTCWHGGGPAVKHVDFSSLGGADVIIWPDHDEVGATAADFMGLLLPSICKSVKRIIPPGGKTKAWDVADAILEDFDVLQLIDQATTIEKDNGRVDEGTLVEPRATSDRPFTDLGNAERFVDMWGHVLRYNIDKNKWLIWSGGRWCDNDQTVVTPMLKRTIRNMAMGDERKEALFWARKSEAAGAINSMMSLARSERGIPVREDNLDQCAYYLNCPNGVVDLRTGELLEPKQEWLITKVTNTKFNPDAECPNFLKFLDETFQEDPGLINFIQRWLGYSLTADVSAQTFAVFYGIGANGKSTLVDTMQKIVGDYCKTAPPETFIQKMSGAGGVPNDVAALRGSRMVLTTETEANAKLAEAKVKSMTGGDRVSARYMRGEFFEFTPTWKITISTNHRPRISGGDYGIWRRVVLVPFNNVVQPERQDPFLPNKLLLEAEGILVWAIRGAMSWFNSGCGRVGLQVPAAVYDETQEYREDEDVIGRFLSQACYSVEEVNTMMSHRQLLKGGTPAQQVFYSFRYWCIQEGEEGYAKTNASQFGRYMRERGHMAERTSAARFYPGVVPKKEWHRLSENYGPGAD